MIRLGAGVLAWGLLAPAARAQEEPAPEEPAPEEPAPEEPAPEEQPVEQPVEPSEADLPTEEDLEPVYVASLRLPWRLVIGFDFGIGIIDATCGGCYSLDALALDAFAGIQLAPRIALLAEVWSNLHLLATDERDSGIASHTITALATRVWLIPRLWIEAGGGMGWLAASSENTVSGPAAFLAVGGEPGHKPCRGIDISIRFGGTLLEDELAPGRTLLYSVSALAGFHWN